MDNRTPINREDLYYPHVCVKQNNAYCVVNVKEFFPVVVAKFDTKDEGLIHAKDLNIKYLEAV